jgi:hypothetical protein
MDGIPRALPSDLEDVAWALQTAESLWKRGDRVDAVVWVRRAAQAAGEGDDAKRAVALGSYAAELSDWIGSHTVTGEAAEARIPSPRTTGDSIEVLLSDLRDGSDIVVLNANDMEVVSAKDFEAGFGTPAKGGLRPSISSRGTNSDSGEIMLVSLHSPDVEVVDEVPPSEEFPEEEPTPVLRQPRSPIPEAGVPSAAQAHAGMLDPWADAARVRKERKSSPEIPPSSRSFEDEEIVTSAGATKSATRAPASGASNEPIPRAPKPPRFPPPKGRAPAPLAAPAEVDTTTYRQVSPRAPEEESRDVRPRAPPARSVKPVQPPPQPPRAAEPLKPALPRSRPVAPQMPARKPAPLPSPSTPAMRSGAPSPPASPQKSIPPALDLLEMADSVALIEESLTRTAAPPHPSAAPTPRPPPGTVGADLPFSGAPTAPPPSSAPAPALVKPSGPPTRPYAGQTLLDLAAVEALSDLPDDAREAFALAATTHTLATDEEVSSFALALVLDGQIDVSATIVDAPALRLERNAILRSRGSIVPGVALRLVCASPKALVATWDTAAVEAAFRTCPWVEEDLRNVTDRVQARAGVTMGPLGERFDQSLREHVLGKLTSRLLVAGEVLIEEGKPTPIAIVGIGELVLTKNGKRGETLRPGDFVFPTQLLAHAPAPSSAAAGSGGAVVLFGDRAVAQELLMGFPPLLEVLATL